MTAENQSANESSRIYLCIVGSAVTEKEKAAVLEVLWFTNGPVGPDWC